MKKAAAAAVVAAVGLLYWVSRKNTGETMPESNNLPGQKPAILPEKTPAPVSSKRGIRNNNPLNIEFNAANQWNGQTGTDGRFAIFSSSFYGIRAAARLMKTYRDKYGLNTVRGIVSRWAPPSENSTKNYINVVVQRAGLFPDLVLMPSDYPALVEAMIYMENGEQPYSLNEIQQAVTDGLK